MCFENIKKNIEKFEADPGLIQTKRGAIDLFCSDCDFYKESDEDLECGAFKLLRRLVERKLLTLEQIRDAVTGE